jgi:hypothetical protein
VPTATRQHLDLSSRRREAKIHSGIAPLNPAKPPEPLTERRCARNLLWIVLGEARQQADPPHPFVSLRVRRERPASRSASNSFDEIASSHCLG